MSRPIDADALIEELKSDRFPGAPYVGVGLKIAIEKICEAPTIEPERKRGEWIVWGGMDIPENHGRHICSLCGEFAPVRCEKPLIKEYLSDFCPSCGADMRGTEDG